MVKIVKKITVKDVVASADKTKFPKYGLVAGKTHAHPLFLILGRLTGVESKDTDKGTYILFRGTFEATRSCDGEKFKATSMILPGPTDGVIEQGWFNAMPRDENGAPDPSRAMPIAFAFNVGVEPQEGGVTGYRYTCEAIDIGDDAETDPLASIRAAASKSLALAAPEPEAKEPAAPDAKADKTAKEPAKT